MESENVIKNMNFLSINFLQKVDFMDFKMDEKCLALLKQFFSDDDEIDSDKGLAEEERIEIFNQVSSEACTTF